MANSGELRGGAQESSIPTLEAGKVLESRFECPICLQCLSEPVLTPCGHRFCKSCIVMWLQREGGVCPVDNQPLNSSTDLFPDNFTRREIQDSLKHEQSSQLVECSFREFGCLSVLHQDEMPTHLEAQIHHHISLLGCAYTKLHQSVESQKIEQKAQEASSLWEPDVKGQVATHQNGSCQGLMRSLYERVVMLEQQNHEQEIQLNNLKRQLGEHIDSVSHDLAMRHCGGVYIWTVSNISSKLANMQDNPRSMFFSPGFYTSPNGYRFCARLNLSPNDRSSIALLIHLMRTDHDACLTWPFTGRISFKLVNARDPSRHICDTMMSRPELDAFKRPLCDRNTRGFGYTEFVSVLDLTTQGFITKDDSIVIRLHVISV